MVTIAAARDGLRVWFDGEIRESEFFGEFNRYEVQICSVQLTVDSPHLSSSPIYAADARVQVGIDPAEVRLLH